MSGPRRVRSLQRALASVRQRHDLPPHFLSTAAISFMLVTGVHILAPVLPLYAERFGISNLEIGMVVGGYAAGRLAFDLVGGVLADRFGTRSTASVGCAITSVASFVGGWTSSFEVLLGARIGQGIGSALYVTATTGLIIALAPPGRLGRLMALYQGIFMVGLAVGPAVGGVIAALLGLNAPFFAYGLMALVCTVFSAFYLPDQGSQAPGAVAHEALTWRVRGGLVLSLMRNRAMILALVATVLVFITRSGVRSTLLPLFADTEFGLNEISVGLLLTVAAVGNVMILGHAGRSMDRSGRRPVTRWSAIGMTVTIGLYAMLVTPWMLFPVTALLGIVTGYAGVAPPVMVADVADDRIRATAIGIQRMATDLGLLMGPLIVGAFADAVGYRRGFLLTAALCAVLAAAAFTMPETMPSCRDDDDAAETDR